MKIAVAGLTHLGVCMSIAAHDMGLEVVAFDTDRGRVEGLRRAEFDKAEPGVIEFLGNGHDRYFITDQVKVASRADLVMIAVDTTLGEDGRNDDLEVVGLLAALAPHVPEDVPIVIASQVRPGFTRAHLHLHRNLYYFMETLIFGRGLERAKHPERYIVGAGEPNASMPVVLADYLSLPGCPIHVMSYESAELTKLAANYVLSASITAANSLADLAQRLGANWRDIEGALRQDQRIGEKAYISAGLGIGGANLSRDLHGIKDMADRLGVDSSLARTMLHHSAHMRDWTLREILNLRREAAFEHLAVLGLAYKPGTESTRGGSGVDLIETFESFVDIRVHDPSAILEGRPPGSRARQVNGPEDALRRAQVVAVTTPWPQYAEVLRKYLATSSDVVVIDPYRVVDPSWSRGPRTRIIQLGVADV